MIDELPPLKLFFYLKHKNNKKITYPTKTAAIPPKPPAKKDFTEEAVDEALETSTTFWSGICSVEDISRFYFLLELLVKRKRKGKKKRKFARVWG